MKYFSINELCRSDRAKRLGIENVPNAEQMENLTALVNEVLDPAREELGHAVRVSSGFRCKAVNDAIPGSSKTSQHTKGEAADLVAGDKKENLKLAQIIIRQGKFDQLILENVPSAYLYPQWVHVSYKREGKNRGQVLKKITGRKGYYAVNTKTVLAL
jgi:hypothetical protein